MTEQHQEPIFAAILLLASGLALATYMLGVLLDPTLAVAVSIVLVALGAAFFIPDGQRFIGAIIGFLSVALAGIVIPRAIAEFTTVADQMAVTLAASGLVLLLAIGVLRLAVFGRQTPRAS